MNRPRPLTFILTALLVAPLLMPLDAFAAGDAAKGKRVFNKCKACHVFEEGKNRVGPTLHKIIGRTAGSLDGFKYSKAMKESGIVWDEQTIAAYLADPKGYIKGNRMSFAGLRKQKDIDNVIAYIIQQAGK